MDSRDEILGAIEVMINKAMEEVTKIQNGTVIAVNGKLCAMTINGRQFNSIQYYGNVPIINKQYRVFIPSGNMNIAFIIVP